MKPAPFAQDERGRILATLAIVAVAVTIVVTAAAAPKIAFYLDRLEQTGALYVLAPAAAAGLALVVKAPRLPLYLLVFLIPFNTIGGAWGEAAVVTLGRVAANLALLGALIAMLLAPSADRAWLRRTELGHAVIAWLLMLGVAIAVGFFSAPRRADWMRETAWMILYLSVLPFGTLITTRQQLKRLLLAGGAGVMVMQALAFWMLATGHRYNRPDVQGGEAFFRAPFSAFSVFYLLLVLSMFFFASSAKGAMTRRQHIVVAALIAVLSAGLLATMGRALWISAAAGGLVILLLVPWRASTVRAAAIVAAGIAGAVGLVVVVDSLSPESRGNWTGLAVDFLFALGEKGSVTKLSRQLEWAHAIDVWKLSPVVGYGFGYPFPDNPYNIQTGDPFYMHNSFMNLLAKCGALGMLAHLWMMVAAVRRLWRTFHHPWAGTEDRILATALLAGLLQLSVLSLFSPALTSTDSIIGGGVLIGLAAVQPRLLRPREAA
jgi:hypothetical protein